MGPDDHLGLAARGRDGRRDDCRAAYHGFDPNLALLFSGVGTLIFFVVVTGRVPSYLGSSFPFTAVVIAASGYSGHGPNPHLDVALGGIIAAGMLYGITALIVMQSGVGWIERLMPPVVTGAVVAAIGLNLAPVAVKSVSGDQFATWIGLLTVLIIGLTAVAAPGLWRRLPIGAIGGYLLYLLLANGSDCDSPSTLRRWPRYHGSGCRNSRARASTAVVSILLDFSPKFGALIRSIPDPVIGGLSIVLFGLIAAMAGRIWVENKVDFSNPRDLITIAAGLTAGASDLTLKFGGFENPLAPLAGRGLG